VRDDAALGAALLRKTRESAATLERFFGAEEQRIVACARAMAEAFARGGRLFTFGNGGSSCDAEHVAVEFMHPVLERRPPLPALALGGAGAFVTAVSNDEDFAVAYAKLLRLHARPADVALGLSTSGKSASVLRALGAASEIGMLRVGFTGRDGGRMAEACDFAFVVPSFSIHRIQEAHVTLLHVIWDLVHLVNGAEDVL
jgi:D-sedoheptulose 7-phosphate isomerase